MATGRHLPAALGGRKLGTADEWSDLDELVANAVNGGSV